MHNSDKMSQYFFASFTFLYFWHRLCYKTNTSQGQILVFARNVKQIINNKKE